MANITDYFVEILNHDLSQTIAKVKSFTELVYEDSVDQGGTGQMSIHYRRPELSRTLLQPMNRIKIHFGATVKWVGYIRKWEINGENVIVDFMGALGILAKRLVTENYSNQDAELIFIDVIDDMNAEDDTGITLGTFAYNVDGVTFTVDTGTDKILKTSHGLLDDDIVFFSSTDTLPDGLDSVTKYYVVNKTSDDFQVSTVQGGTPVNIVDSGTGTHKYHSAKRAFDWDKQDIFSSLKNLADSAGGELYIDNDFTVHIAAPRGSDKSESVEFKSIDSRPNETNIQDVDVVYDGDKLVNRVIGNNSTLSSTKEDPTSQSTYGLLEEAVSFSTAGTQATLDEETQNHLTTFKDPLEIPSIKPISRKIAENLYDVGDTITVKIERGFYELDTQMRIVSKRVIVRSDKQEVDVEVGLSDRAQSRSDLLREIAVNARRVYNLERA